MDEKTLWVQTLWNPLNELNKSPLESKEDGIRVAAYCRASHRGEVGHRTLLNQVSSYTKMIRSKENWKFVGIYFDYGKSGASSNNRSSFKRLIRHCEEGRLDLILVKSISRFARNTKDILNTVDRLKEIGVTIYFEKENLDTSRDYNRLMLNAYAAISQAEVENMSEAKIWSVEKKLMRGEILLITKYGYDIKDSDIKVNEEEAEVVRWIYNQFLSGSSYSEIARELNKKEVKTKKGTNLWTPSCISRIIKDITYTGSKLTRTITNDPLTKKRVRAERDEILIENSHPAIISNEIFNAAQDIAKKIETSYAERDFSNRKFRPLTKRVLCGYCGHFFNIYDKNKWRCRTSAVGKELCKSDRLTEKDILELIINALKMKFDFEDESKYEDEVLIRSLQKVIKEVNDNDNFEFYRLKYLTEIELDAHETGENLKDLWKKYDDFESKFIEIENDRVYRDDAIAWLDNIRSIDDFIKGLTIELLRAWVVKIKMYNKNAYIVYWVDGDETVIGEREIKNLDDEIKRRELISAGEEKGKYLEPSLTFNELNLSLDKQDFNTKELIKEDKEEEQLTVTTSLNTNVVKLNPGDTIFSILNLDNSIKRFDKKFNDHLDEKKLRVCSYCRVSTDSSEQKVSYRGQISYYTYLILRNKNWEFAGIFADEGISGLEASKRKDFLRMIEECKAGKIDLIITKSISRFSRNIVETLEYIRMLKALPDPVHIFFEKENINTKDDTSEFIINLHSVTAQEESNAISANVTWSQRKYAQRGKITFNRKRYGYDIHKGKWTINEEEAKVVRRIYNDYLEGNGTTKIVAGLYKDGIKGPSGKEAWSHHAVFDIIRNEIYKGDYLYQKTFKNDVTDKRRENTGQLPQYYLENHHEPIIDAELWDKVQEEIQKRSVGLGDSKEKNGRESFYKKFYCSTCKGLIGKTFKYKENDLHFWRCHSTMINKHGLHCSDFSISQNYMEYNFMNMLMDIKGNKNFRNRAEERISELHLSKDEIRQEDEIRKEMESLNQKLYDVVDKELNYKGRDVKKIDSITGEIVKLREELSKLTDKKEKANKCQDDFDWLIKEINKLKEIDQVREIEEIEMNGVKEGDKINADNKTKSNNKSKEIKRIKKINGLKDIDFRDDIFKRVVDHGEMDCEGLIKYHFTFGVEHHIDMIYKKDKNKRLQKVLEQVLEYCKEPRKSAEIMAVIDIECGYTYLYNKIINRLIDEGKLQRTNPECPADSNQMYYTIES